MARQNKYTLPEVLMEVLFSEEEDILRLLMERLLNLGMVAERQAYLQAEPYQRTVEEALGLDVSSATVSRAAQELEETLQAWRERPLGAQPCPYLYLDAHYEHVRVDGQVRDVAVLVAVGIWGRASAGVGRASDTGGAGGALAAVFAASGGAGVAGRAVDHQR